MQQQWHKLVTAKSPCIVEASEGTLQVHGCCFPEGGSAPSTLYASVAGQLKCALGRVAAPRPFCQVRAAFGDGVRLSCEGGDVLVLGVLHPDLTQEPPAKVAKLEDGKQATTPAKGSDVAAPTEAAPGQKRKAGGAAAQAPATASPKASAPGSPATQKQGGAKEAQKPAAQDKASTEAKAVGSPKAPASPKVKPAAAPADPFARRVLGSGLEYQLLKVGKGTVAMVGKNVQVRYEGRLAKNQQRFDKGMIKFRLGMGEVIRGWDEGVKGMLVGEKRRLLVPARLGYGNQGAPPVIPPNANLIFEVELLNA